eukprot:gene3262-5108_t
MGSEEDNSDHVAWSKYAGKTIVEETSRVGKRDDTLRLNEQLKAVCEVHAATSNALSVAEEQVVKHRREIHELRCELDRQSERNTGLCLQQTRQEEYVRSLKEKLLQSQDKLGTLVDYQCERADLIQQNREQQQAMDRYHTELDALRKRHEETRKRLEAKASEADHWKRQTEAQLRCNDLMTDDVTRLKRTVSTRDRKQGEASARTAQLEAEAVGYRKRLDTLSKELSSRERMVADLETEGKRLKRDRVLALRTLQDEQDKAKERELLIRSLRRENASLREANVASATHAESMADPGTTSTHLQPSPVSVIQVGDVPAPSCTATDSLLLNLKKQNKLQMKSLANTLQLLLSVDAKEKTLA